MESLVLASRRETHDTVTVRVRAEMSIVPGQFVMLGALIKPLEREVKRSYSVSGWSKDEGWVEVTIKRQPGGLFSSYAENLAPGDAINIYGPFGKHFVWEPSVEGNDSPAPVVWIAGGSGIAPFRTMIQSAIENNYKGKITLLFSVKSKADWIYSSEMDSWREDLPNLRVVVALTRPTDGDLVGWSGLVGRIGEGALKKTLSEELSAESASKFFVCGSTPMVRDIEAVLGRLGIAPARIVTEKYGAIEG